MGINLYMKKTDCFYETEMDLKNAETVIEADGSEM